MPSKPAWYSNIDNVIERLRASPRPYVDRAKVESLLGVGRRRAQQIMAPCIRDHVGASGLADRDGLIEHLRRLASGEDVSYEIRRRRRLAGLVGAMRRERLERPQLLVEAPVQVIDHQIGTLPPGVYVEPGRITVEFSAPREALEKLLALAMAIGNDFDTFERAVV